MSVGRGFPPPGRHLHRWAPVTWHLPPVTCHLAALIPTCRQVQDTFFTGLLSGRIQSGRDEQGAIFIDRDPDLFKHILSYLRNHTVTFGDINFKELRHEAEFYGIAPLVKKLSLCADLDISG